VSDGESALLGPADVRRLAEELGIRPTKKLGQNFVHDPNTVRRIVAAAGLAPDDVVLEVGPGLGSLTLALLPLCAHLHAVEIDPRLAGALPELDFACGLGTLSLFEGDVVADAVSLRPVDGSWMRTSPLIPWAAPMRPRDRGEGRFEYCRVTVATSPRVRYWVAATAQ